MSTLLFIVIVVVIAYALATFGVPNPRPGVIPYAHLKAQVDLSKLYVLPLNHPKFSPADRKILHALWGNPGITHALVYLCGDAPDTIGEPNEEGKVHVVAQVALGRLRTIPNYRGLDVQLFVDPAILTDSGIEIIVTKDRRGRVTITMPQFDGAEEQGE